MPLPSAIGSRLRELLAGRGTGEREGAGHTSSSVPPSVSRVERANGASGSLDALLLDLRLTVRVIGRHPGFTSLVVLILAIGIGATTALFSMVSTVLLRGLPYEDPERLVIGLKTLEGELAGPVSRPDYFDFRDRSRSFQQLASMGNFASEVPVQTGDTFELVNVGFASWNLFATLGLKPVAGRGFLPEDEDVGGSTSVVISHRLWTKRFGRSPEAVGSTLHLGGETSTIVGVLPPGFRFLHDIDVWGLIDRQGPFDLQRDAHSLVVVGRLQPGVSLGQAQAEVDRIAAALRAEYPETNDSKGLWLGHLNGYMVRGVRTSLILLMATTALVLLISCANVAGLLLARGQQRLPEMAMRAALGAPRRRLVRQLMTESLIIALVAGAAGIGVAWLVQHLVARLLPVGALGAGAPVLDARALVFALLVSTATGLVVGVVPALRSTADQPARQMVAGTRASESVHSARLRSGLVVLQVAISIPLLIVSALLARSLVRLASVDLGFDRDNLFTARVQIHSPDYPSPEERSQFFTTLVARVRSLPGVRAAAATTKLPILNPWQDWPIWPAGMPRPLPSQTRFGMARWVTPGYFETLGIAQLAGRDISLEDGPRSPRVVVLSESVARSLFQDRDAIGQDVKIGWSEEPWRVVGIVAEARLNSVDQAPVGAIYMPAAQAGPTRLALAVRTAGEPMGMAAAVRELVRELDGHAIVSGETTMDAIVDDQLAGSRVVLLALGLLSAVALLLAATGLYGVLAYSVAQRSREIGVRMALGAAPWVLVRRFVVGGLGLVAAGIALGLLCALPSARLVQSLLFEVAPWDLTSVTGALVFLSLLGLLASLIPALRVTRVDPARTLRAE